MREKKTGNLQHLVRLRQRIWRLQSYVRGRIWLEIGKGIGKTALRVRLDITEDSISDFLTSYLVGVDQEIGNYIHTTLQENAAFDTQPLRLLATSFQFDDNGKIVTLQCVQSGQPSISLWRLFINNHFTGQVELPIPPGFEGFKGIANFRTALVAYNILNTDVI